MPELCRNFQRGSCRYGERCKFLHSVQQQTKPTSPFGFGSGQQQQQQSSNPYGFGAKQQQNKPFGNTWNRFNPSDNEAGHAPSSTKQKPDSKTQAANHTCTDPETCKRLIAEDFEQERPIWKLTCYGHARNGPCDIVGDISYEELRAVAYDDAKRGINVQSIVERERNLSNSKLVEFQNLLQTPYVARLGSAVGMQNLFPRATTNGMSPTGLSSAPPQVSSFSQLGASLNTGFGARPSGPTTNNVPNQPNAFSSSFPTSNPFGVRPPAQVNNLFGKPSTFPNSTQNPGAFGTNNIPSVNGSFGGQLANQQQGNLFPSNAAGFPTSGAGSNVFSSLGASPHTSQSFTAQSPISSNVNASSLSVSVAKEKGSGDMSIWSKETWRPGEIPEEAPADEYVY
ncbi:Zinc finger CCCH domain-containing protein 16 [Linum perenne]